ncbi:MAG TPA: DNA mismatch repair protein MutS [Candidatus Gallacutalibacter pullistercoris]|nr:DNA mismatch repair protein MutS [Candidatus Gallacutalibacter pullistercoris]
MADLSPMMKQYLRLKEENPDTLLFFRLGDFYEMFFEDAKIASRELDLTLTGRDCGLEERAPMCGVPFHSYENYLARLVQKGYKVAICEQMEDPATAKGLVKRDIIRVVTPGTILENSMLDEGKNNYLASVCVENGQAGVCFADVSTGELHATLLTDDDRELEQQVCGEFSRFSPREILINPTALDFKHMPGFVREKLSAAMECLSEEECEPEICRKMVLEQFHAKTEKELGDAGTPLIVRAVGQMLGYLHRTQRGGLERLENIEYYEKSRFMRLDLNTRRNLELTETMRSKEKKGSLLWVLDKTRTAMGKRQLRSWMEQPLLSPGLITRRLNAVEELLRDPMFRDGVVEQLTGMQDLERIMSRIVYGSANGRELRALWSALCRLPGLKQQLSNVSSEFLKKVWRQIDPMEDVCSLIDRAIVEEPPFSIREGGIIHAGYSEELDQLRSDMTGGKGLLASVEARERERTGIPKLKIGYNRVFGYYIEVTNSYRSQVPDEYIRKQTLTNCERYITPELKELENRILGASDRSVQLESRLFEEVRKKVAAEMGRVQMTARAVAALDVVASFAQVSAARDYVRPTVNVSGRLILKDSRHPVVEALLHGAPFVPNDVELDMNRNRVAIITGPNMAGKSTYMRQIALIVLMAQIGCFVPAASAEIGIVDGIYTRVGASDDLAAGQSTFMVEMTEVADILRHATPNSLLVLDEIGRGTSTFDGMSIARAVLEYVADPKLLGAKALFATHYHELTELEEQLEGVRNFSIAVKKHGDDITFLRRIVRGGADDSFGVEVAKLAGVPDKVVRRARQILKELESGVPVTAAGKKKSAKEEPAQMTMLETAPQGQVLRRLRELDVNTLTPIECMNELFSLVKLAKEHS